MKFHTLLSILTLLAMTASCTPQPAATKKPEIQTPQSSLATKPAVSSDEIVSTDPATFQIASGELQLVEFFTFT